MLSITIGTIFHRGRLIRVINIMKSKYQNELKFPLYGFSIPLEEYAWIRDRLTNESTILEIGAGPGSTGNLSQFYQMYSIEHNLEYINNDHKNCNYIHAPLKNGWYDINILTSAIKDIKYDLILVDGPPGESNRHGFYTHLNIFNTGVPIVFDDTHRPGEYSLANNVGQALNRPVLHMNVHDELSVYNQQHGFSVIDTEGT